MTPKSLLYSILNKAYTGKLVSQNHDEKNVQDILNTLNISSWFSEQKNKKYLNDEKPNSENDIPSSWAYVKLGYLLNFISTGKNYKYESIENKNYCIGQKNNQEYGIEPIGIKYIGDGDWKSISSNYFLKHNDVLINSLGTGTMGRCGIWKSNLNKSTFDSCVFVLRTNELLYPDYLYYYLKLNRTKLEKLATGSTNQKSINKKEIVNFFIPLAPIEEQKRIVSKIEELLPLVNKYNGCWSKLEKFNSEFPIKIKKSILQYAVEGKLVEQDKNEGSGFEFYNEIRAEKEKLIKLGKIKKEKPFKEITYKEIPFTIPSNWSFARLNAICTKIVDGDHNPPSGVVTKTNYLMLSAININNNSIVELGKVRYLNKEIFEVENERTMLQKGDILFTIVGTLGRSCIYKGGLNLCFQRSVSVISTLINNLYLKYVLDSPYIQNFMLKNSTGTAQKGFYLEKVNDLIIPIPPLKEQERIVAKIEELLSLCKRLIK